MVDRRVLNWTCSASNGNQLCVTQTLSSVETAVGTLTLSKLVNVVSAVASGQTNSLDGANLCTPCVKQIYNVANNDFPAIFGQGAIASDVKADCGASFVGKSIVSYTGVKIDLDSLNHLSLVVNRWRF